MALLFIQVQDRLLEVLRLRVAHVAPVAGELFLLDRGQDAGCLLAAHDRDARIGPHEQKARIVGAAAHGVVAGAKGTADDHG